jgi:hypothetical protein
MFNKFKKRWRRIEISYIFARYDTYNDMYNDVVWYIKQASTCVKNASTLVTPSRVKMLIYVDVYANDKEYHKIFSHLCNLKAYVKSVK